MLGWMPWMATSKQKRQPTCASPDVAASTLGASSTDEAVSGSVATAVSKCIASFGTSAVGGLELQPPSFCDHQLKVPCKHRESDDGQNLTSYLDQDERNKYVDIWEISQKRFQMRREGRRLRTLLTEYSICSPTSSLSALTILGAGGASSFVGLQHEVFTCSVTGSVIINVFPAGNSAVLVAQMNCVPNSN